MNQRQRAALAERYQSDGMKAATPQKLLLLVFERLERDLEEARVALETNQVEVGHRSLLHAQDLIHELNLALDPDVWPAAVEMRQVYEHLIDRLVEANLTKSGELVRACQEIVRPLAKSWAEAHQTLQQNLAEVIK